MGTCLLPHARLHAALITTALLAGAGSSSIRAQAAATDTTKRSEDVVVLEKFVAQEKAFDPTGLIDNRPVNSAFGFDKPVVEAPKRVYQDPPTPTDPRATAPTWVGTSSRAPSGSRAPIPRPARRARGRSSPRS